jgi:hypothetical protein
LQQVANLCYQKAHYAASELSKIKGFKVFKSRTILPRVCFAVPSPRAKSTQYLLDTRHPRRIRSQAKIIPRCKNHLLVAVTEMNSKEEIDTLVEILSEEMVKIMAATRPLEPTIFELSSPGRRGVRMPASDVPTAALPPKDLLRSELPLPELAEVDVVRHYMKLSKFNYSVDERLLSAWLMHHEIQPEDQRRHLPLPGFFSRIHCSRLKPCKAISR